MHSLPAQLALDGIVENDTIEAALGRDALDIAVVEGDHRVVGLEVEGQGDGLVGHVDRYRHGEEDLRGKAT